MTDLAVIVVTHDDATQLEACVASVADCADGAAIEVIVVDSGSTDATEDVARRLAVRFLAGSNRGFAAGCNRGLVVAEETGARYVLLLNPDARLVAGSLSRLVAECDRRPRAGIVTGRLVDRHGRLVHNMGVAATPREYLRMALRGWGNWDWTTDHYDGERSCAWVEGSFLVARRETLDELGGLDERFFMYSEDVDLGRRARAAGWDVLYLPVVTAAHDRDRPFDAHRAQLLASAKLLYIRKWYSGPSALAMRAGLALFHVRQIVHRRRDGVPALSERVQLRTVLRPEWERYGPAQR
jgi:N-acetylglucosaminyl-diphospho-decaprenol L-rhamnosyltransferase